MPNNLEGKKILILGASTWHVPYIQKAKILGIKTYVTDWLENAEGKRYADVFKQIDLRNKSETLKFAKENHIDAIFTSADIGVQTAAYVAQKLDLEYHTEELAFNATNKEAMREKAKELDINTPLFSTHTNIGSAKQAANKIGYPVIIKPIDNFSSKGVFVVNNEEYLKSIFKESLSASFDGKILIEEFMSGIEGSIEALVQNGKTYIMGICDKKKSKLPHRFDIELNYPGSFTNQQYENIKLFLDKLVKGFEIKSGIIHVEIIVNDDSVKLIEFGIRGCGSKVVTHLLPKLLKFDVVKFLILNSFGFKQNIIFCKKNYGILKFIILDHGEIKAIKGKEKVRKINGIIDFDIERKSGDIIEELKDGRSRPGYLLAESNNKENLNKIVNEALSYIKVKYA